MNLQLTLPLAAAVQIGEAAGLPSTLNEPVSEGMLVVVEAGTDVVVEAGAEVVVVEAATVVVVLGTDVVTGVGFVEPPPPQLAPARTVAASSAVRPYACDANLRGLDGAIILPSRSNRLVKPTYCKGPGSDDP